MLLQVVARRRGCRRSPRSGWSAARGPPCAAPSSASSASWCTRACTRRAAAGCPSAPASWSCSSSPGGPCGPAAESWASGPRVSLVLGRSLRRSSCSSREFCAAQACCCRHGRSVPSDPRGRACRPAYGPVRWCATPGLCACLRPLSTLVPVSTLAHARAAWEARHEGKEYRPEARRSKRDVLLPPIVSIDTAHQVRSWPLPNWPARPWPTTPTPILARPARALDRVWPILDTLEARPAAPRGGQPRRGPQRLAGRRCRRRVKTDPLRTGEY